jgi:hypothetical protein
MFGLQVANAAGVLTFDSTVAVGGVCLGFYTVPSGGGTPAFSQFPTEAGFVMASGRSVAALEAVTFDHAPGYLRFVFPASVAGQTFVLWAR